MNDTTTLTPTEAEILDAAKSAGFYFHDAGYAPTLHTTPHEYSQKSFERFARAVLAKWGAPAPASGDAQDCPNCFEGKSDLDHDCRKCNGTGKAPPAQEARVPLTPGQRGDIRKSLEYEGADGWQVDWGDVIDAVEKHHGITAAQKETP